MYEVEGGGGLKWHICVLQFSNENEKNVPIQNDLVSFVKTNKTNSDTIS